MVPVQLKARGDSASASRTAPVGVREEQRLGQKNPLDVLNAERELAEREVKLIEARRDLVQASYPTLASMGRGKWWRRKQLPRGQSAGKPRSKRTILQKESSHPGAFRRYGIAPIRLRTNIVVGKTPLSRQTLTAIAW
jgi:hypothetical protein